MTTYVCLYRSWQPAFISIKLLCANSTSYVLIGFPFFGDSVVADAAAEVAPSTASVCRTLKPLVVPRERLHIVAAGPRSWH